MANRFVLCRRVDDHSVTSEIAETALPHQTLWEPIPAEDEPAPDAAKVQAIPPQPEPSSTTSRKSRIRAATDNKE
jgi:hypothetical protein